MRTDSLRHIDNELDIRIVVRIRSTGDQDILISHANVLGIDAQVFWRGHHNELDRAVIAKGIIGPCPNGPYFFHRGNAIVTHQYLGDHAMTTGRTHKRSNDILMPRIR